MWDSLVITPGEVKLGISSSQIKAVLDTLECYRAMAKLDVGLAIRTFDWERIPLTTRKPQLHIVRLKVAATKLHANF